jgi:hypothetical protein
MPHDEFVGMLDDIDQCRNLPDDAVDFLDEMLGADEKGLPFTLHQRRRIMGLHNFGTLRDDRDYHEGDDPNV